MGLAYILSIVTGRVKRALPLLVAALIPTITVGGYFMNIQSIPAWLKGLAVIFCLFSFDTTHGGLCPRPKNFLR